MAVMMEAAAHDVSAYTAVTKYKPVCVSDDE